MHEWSGGGQVLADKKIRDLYCEYHNKRTRRCAIGDLVLRQRFVSKEKCRIPI
ncbi:hypothetical protein DPMN_102306 [Dreissena polymorpha]|uniref:Uncharacterized protein n=1 Tax=Dreissena polymorpha TaxID=45954 RepID=A0A9D4LKE4_DREPO|nr:hypothetical protein DPMN_102306 [Dreissena polymorpha]